MHACRKLTVDATFLTNAEYQVFLAETKNADLIPDHWTGSRFSKGEGSHPVAVVRYSQAEVFCEWMTERFGGPSSKFAIPSAEKLQAVPPADAKQEAAQDEIGCWCDPNALVGGGRNIEILRMAATRAVRLLIMGIEAHICHKALFFLDLAYVDITPARDDLRRIRGRLLMLAQNMAHALYRSLARDLDLGLNLVCSFAFELDRALGREISEPLVTKSELVDRTIRDFTRAIARDLDRARAMARGRARDLADGVLAGDLVRSALLHRALDLDTTLERILDNSRARPPDDVLILNLGGVLNGTDEMARNLDGLHAYLYQDLRGSQVLRLITGPEPDSPASRVVLLKEMRKGAIVGGIRIAKQKILIPGE